MNNINKILIEDIENSKNKEVVIDFDARIPEIPTEGNVKAKLKLTSLGEFVKIDGKVSLKAILECDLCLKEFTQEIEFNLEEMFAKNKLMEEYSQELELKEGQFITDLNGAEEIDIEDLLYQSVIINLPNKKVCGINCNEGIFETDEEYEIPDDRMKIFKEIKIEKKK